MKTKLDSGLDEAHKRGRTPVSMKRDWKPIVFVWKKMNGEGE